MIVLENLPDEVIRIYSDTGKKIIQIETGRIYSVAYEKDTHYKYIEVEQEKSL